MRIWSNLIKRLLNITAFLICSLLLFACHKQESTLNAKSPELGVDITNPQVTISLGGWDTTNSYPTIRFTVDNEAKNSYGYLLTYNIDIADATLSFYDNEECTNNVGVVTTTPPDSKFYVSFLCYIRDIPNMQECIYRDSYVSCGWFQSNLKAYKISQIKNMNCWPSSYANGVNCNVNKASYSMLPVSPCYKCLRR